MTMGEKKGRRSFSRPPKDLSISLERFPKPRSNSVASDLAKCHTDPLLNGGGPWALFPKSAVPRVCTALFPSPRPSCRVSQSDPLTRPLRGRGPGRAAFRLDDHITFLIGKNVVSARPQHNGFTLASQPTVCWPLFGNDFGHRDCSCKNVQRTGSRSQQPTQLRTPPSKKAKVAPK